MKTNEKIIELLEELIVLLKEELQQDQNSKEEETLQLNENKKETEPVNDLNVESIPPSNISIKEEKLSDYIKEIDSEKSLEIFETLKPGDIVYAPTTQDIKKIKLVKPGHKIRPFIVAKITENGFYGYSGTSDSNRKYTYSFYLSNVLYDGIKGGVINLAKASFIKKQNIISYIEALKTSDIVLANNIISQVKNTKIHPLIEKEINLMPNMSIIDSDEQLYYISDVNDNEIIAYKYVPSIKRCTLNYHDMPYAINRTKSVKLNKEGQYRVVQLPYHDLLKPLKNQKESSTKKKKESPSITVKDCKFKYAIGQTLNSGNRVLVYLFSQGDDDYIVELFENGDISPVTVLKKKDQEYFVRGRLLDTADILEIVSSIAIYNKKYRWLKNHVFGAYKKQLETSKDKQEPLIEEIKQEEVILC